MAVVGNIEKAFSRQGPELHLSELRAGVLPLYATLPIAFIWGFLLSLSPWVFLTALRLILFIASGGATQQAHTADGLTLWSTIQTAWPYGLAFGAACAVGSLLRRYSARRNKYLVYMIGQFAEFRASYGEIATALGIAASLLALSETARELNLLVVMLAPIASMIVQDCQDFTLKLYARLSKNYVAESVYSVWELLRTREDARNARVNHVGALSGGRVLMLSGTIPDQSTLDFLSRLPLIIHGVDRVIVNGQELYSRVPLRPTHAQQ
jgi:hypothetical protein